MQDDYQLIEVGGWENRYRALLEGKISATLLTEPFVRNALAANCNLLARDFEMIPSYQGTCGATSRHWAEQHPERLSRYIRAYVEATQWCFDRRNRRSCLDILARHNEIDGPAAEHTLDTLLDPEHGLYPKATINSLESRPLSICEPSWVTWRVLFRPSRNMSIFLITGKPCQSAHDYGC
jgi:ABC-type nitrate/sulfonate/bicarbonate transport system substrate-binding protein